MFPSEKEMKRVLAERHGVELQSKFFQTSVAVCGLGGLGSNIAIALARAGIGRLHLIDFDKVDISNLHRQQYFIKQIGMYKTEALKETILGISPYIHIIINSVRITEGNLTELLLDDDIICEALDNAEAKAMLVNGVLEQFQYKKIVAASGMAGIFSANSIHTRKINSQFYVCGDEVNAISNDIGIFSSRVMLCAAHQSHMVLRIIAGEKEV